MKRGLKIALASMLGLLVVLALLLALATHLNWNAARPWLADKMAHATGRDFAINGDLTLQWEPPPEMQGWKKYVPWPHFRAYDVVLGNPDWATTGPHMAEVEQVDFTISLLRLFGKTISVEQLRLAEPDLVFEKDKKDRNNWTFSKKEETQSAWRFEIQNLAIASGNVRYVDPAKAADARARIDTLEDGSVKWKLGGKFNGEKLSGHGTAGSLLALQSSGERYPVEADIKVGETTIVAKGTVTDPSHPSALDIELKILGASMADLFPLSGVLLPETPKFSTEGRVVGRLEPGRMHLRYEEFKGKVGSSDIGGTLEYVQQEPRPMLRGKVVSNLLNISDLSELVGAGDDGKQKPGEVKQPPGKVFPVAPFRTQRWGKMDVDVRFSANKIVRAEALPVDKLHTEIRVDNGVLSLSPLNFGIAGGRLNVDLRIDGRPDPAKARLKVSARGVRLKELFPTIESMQASVGEINGNAVLTATGNSYAALLGSADGEVKAVVTEGTISKFVLEAAGLNIGAVVVTKLFGDHQVPLHCMAADLPVNSGVLKPRFFVLDTSEATVYVTGNINLKNETYNLTIHPDSKGVRVLSLRAPLYVRGTFKNPDIVVDKETVALKAGAAAVLGAAAAPLAGLLALINSGPAEDSPCASLVKEASEKPAAPPPGKSAAGRAGR